jgi:hypothetical protein
MIKVTADHIDNVHDALNLMQIVSDRLLHGEIGDNEASSMSWLLGSTKKRLEPVLHLLEEVEYRQENRRPADLALVSEIADLQKRFDALKAKLEGAA